MIAGFTGSQEGWTERQRMVVDRRLRVLRDTCPSLEVAHGACIGADDQFDALAVELGLPRHVYPSTVIHKSALDRCLARGGVLLVMCEPMHPLKRNPLIVKASDRLLACPKEDQEVRRSGTWATIRAAERILGKDKIEIVWP